MNKIYEIIEYSIISIRWRRIYDKKCFKMLDLWNWTIIKL